MNCNLRSVRNVLLAAVLLSSAGSRLSATPYASGITNTAGTISFILNESADNVKVIFDGGGAGNTNDLGARAKGVHTFALGSHTSWAIHVAKSSPQVWTRISEDTNVFNQFYAPRTIDVNRNPASPAFGRVYVMEFGSTTGPGTTGTGRTVSKGIFALNADLSDAIGQGDTGFTGGLEGGGLFTTLGNRFDPWKISVGEDDYVYIANAQNERGSIARVDANLANGELVLDGVGNTARPDVHTVVYGLQARGSLTNNNLKIYGMDGQWQNETACNIVLRWDVNQGPLPYGTAPTTIVQPGLPTAELETDLDIAPDGNIFTFMYRAVVDAGAVKVYTPTGDLLWSSRDGTNDAFLNCTALEISADGTKLAVARRDRQVWVVTLFLQPGQ
jgi:hypothetical protein